MTPLIAMPGPWLPEADPRRASTANREAFAPMPTMTRLLHRARRLPGSVDWRAGVLTALGADAALAPATIAACAVPQLEPQTPLCLVAPLHAVAGISRVHLAPGGHPQFETGEEQAWCTAFNTELGDAHTALHIVAAGGGWLLQAPFADAARDAPPEVLIGAALHRQAAEGSAERALRRLAAECEMWLAGHALNRAREARGWPPINVLWFWGGARAVPLPPIPIPLIATTDPSDAWLAGLARHAGQPLRSANGFAQAMSALDGNQDQRGHTALLVPAPDKQGASRQYWQMVDEDWIAPALRAIETRQITGLRLQVGRSAWQARRRNALGWLRWRRHGWWQMTGEARP